jgi:hypothetical protein
MSIYINSGNTGMMLIVHYVALSPTTAFILSVVEGLRINAVVGLTVHCLNNSDATGNNITANYTFIGTINIPDTALPYPYLLNYQLPSLTKNFKGGTSPRIYPWN